jgi:hypothetical protein
MSERHLVEPTPELPDTIRSKMFDLAIRRITSSRLMRNLSVAIVYFLLFYSVTGFILYFVVLSQ